MSAVGFDLYAQMLSQAVNLTREGESISDNYLPEALSDIAINVPDHTYIPEEYVPDADERVLFYRKLASADTIEFVDELARDHREAWRNAASYGQPIPESAVESVRERAQHRADIGDGRQAHRRAYHHLEEAGIRAPQESRALLGGQEEAHRADARGGRERRRHYAHCCAGIPIVFFLVRERGVDGSPDSSCSGGVSLLPSGWICRNSC